MIVDTEIIGRSLPTGKIEKRTLEKSPDLLPGFTLWVRFRSDNGHIWYTCLSGRHGEIVLSKTFRRILIKTTNTLYLIDALNEKLIGKIPDFKGLITLSPMDELLVIHEGEFYRVIDNFENTDKVRSPIPIEVTELHRWDDKILYFEALDIKQWHTPAEFYLDTGNWTITKIK
ncbi:hypothetical protein Dip510_001395 [Elusimicrobium posterum]|uniref:hypothetical protein n=1 Tax=Elusimicrobium posterum TaxID=3116653 RepID=UPI003C7465CE